jgi:YggT family protein
MCQLDQLIVLIFRAYSLVLLVYALISWLPDLRGAWVRYLAMLVEPVLAPIRRIIPSAGGLDLSFIALLVLINFVIVPMLQRATFSACYF